MPVENSLPLICVETPRFAAWYGLKKLFPFQNRYRRRSPCGWTPTSWVFLGFSGGGSAGAESSAADRRRGSDPMQNGGGDDCISKNRFPIAITFIGSEDDAAPFITCADELEKIV